MGGDILLPHLSTPRLNMQACENVPQEPSHASRSMPLRVENIMTPPRTRLLPSTAPSHLGSSAVGSATRYLGLSVDGRIT